VLSVVFTMLAGAGAGCLGALLGLGGGMFLVPVLDSVLHGDFAAAKTISLVAVIATSSFVTLASHGRRFLNLRLAMLLQMFTVIGATAGNAVTLGNRPSRLVFAVTAIVVAVIMMMRRHQRNVIHDTTIDVGKFGGRFHDDDTREDVAYRVRRLPLGLAIAFAAGVLSTLIGVGGGVLIVPVLNAWCGVPIRVAAATSALVIGVTAVPGVVGGYAAGNLTQPLFAAAGVLGVLAGSRAGFWISARSRVKALKTLLAGVLVVMAVRYFVMAR
jgi:uncharacterized membrane protein YfcA